MIGGDDVLGWLTETTLLENDQNLNTLSLSLSPLLLHFFFLPSPAAPLMFEFLALNRVEKESEAWTNLDSRTTGNFGLSSAHMKQLAANW